MPRQVGRIRQRGSHSFFRLRVSGKDQNIRLPDDPDLAVLRVREIRRRMKAGLPLMDEPKPCFTVEELVRAWLKDQVAHSRHQRFAEETERRCEAVLIPFMGKMPVDDVKASTLFAYRSHVAELPGRTGPKASAATQRMYLGDLRAAIYHGMTLGVLDRSPIPRRWLPGRVKKAPDCFTQDEQTTLKHLPGDYGRVLRLLLGTGMRFGECVRAQATDIRGRKLLIPITKSGEPRLVPLPPDVLVECRNRVGRLCPFADVVSFNKRVRRLSGIERFRSHLCRHTYATNWRNAGNTLAGLKSVLGHEDISTTEIYGSITEELVEREAARLWEPQTGQETGQVVGENR